MKYTNPQTEVTIHDWPYGRDRTKAHFIVEHVPGKGERVIRTTVNPKTGKPNAPKKTTFSAKARIATGEDGRLYILRLTEYNFIDILESNMKYCYETIHSENSEFEYTLSLLIN